MTAEPDLSTFTAEIRYALNVLKRLNERRDYPQSTEWSVEQLDRAAAQIGAEDADRAALVEQLAREMHAANPQEGPGPPQPHYPHVRDVYVVVAKALVESGWRKGDPA